MKEYTIRMPFTGVVTRAVEADTEEEAIKKFMMEVSLDDIETWEPCRQIVKGNVFYGVQNTTEIEVY
jgi:hypothetical protein